MSIVLLMATLCSGNLFARTTESAVREDPESQRWTYFHTLVVDLVEGQSCYWWYSRRRVRHIFVYGQQLFSKSKATLI